MKRRRRRRRREGRVRVARVARGPSQARALLLVVLALVGRAAARLRLLAAVLRVRV
jgi:hypothetical protein